MSGTADLCARRHKNIYIEREKRDDERRHALGTSVGVSFFERKIASDNVSLVFQSLTQSSVAHLGPASTNRDIANLRIAGRCARAGSGHTTMPRRTVMSSRRRISAPRSKLHGSVRTKRLERGPEPFWLRDRRLPLWVHKLKELKVRFPSSRPES